jgi:capsular exopolysaccharide synthesis family protein
MSRIHEAIKKAEQQRESNVDLQTGAIPPEAVSVVGSAASEAQAGTDPASSGHLWQEDRRVGKPAGPLGSFTEQCLQTEWSPDPSTILYYDEEFRTPGSEDFRTLRSRLDLVRQRQSLQTLVITSPMAGEGKTFIAANLAQVIAWHRERHVLLIDGDLRSSKLHRALGVPGAPGLSEYLAGQVDELSIVRRGPMENFFFIAAGTTEPNASELIANGRLRKLLKRLAVAFDWIIIDSPPVIPVADARLIAESCDGVLLVLKVGHTTGDLAQLAFREFRGKPFVGVVLNRVEPGSTYGRTYYTEMPIIKSGPGEQRGK